jgi:hypothetical protein
LGCLINVLFILIRWKILPKMKWLSNDNNFYSYTGISLIQAWWSVLLVEETGVPPTCRKSLTNLITYVLLYCAHLVMSVIQTHNFSGDRPKFYWSRARGLVLIVRTVAITQLDYFVIFCPSTIISL